MAFHPSLAVTGASLNETLSYNIVPPKPTPSEKPPVITIFKTTELTGVQVAIIIAAGITVFLLLSILAQRQIQRMMFCKNLLRSSVPKLTELPGISREVSLLIHERMLRSCDIDGHMYAWNEKFNRPFFREENPTHYWRAKAVDQCNRILPVLHSLGGRRSLWLPHECVDDFFVQHHADFPYNEIADSTLNEFCQIYKKLRFGEGKYDESHYHSMRQIVDAVIDDLLRARQAEDLMTGEDGDTISRQRATTLDSSVAATNRTYGSKLNMSETSGKALLLPRLLVEPEGLPVDSNTLRDRRVSPLGYARLSPEVTSRFPNINYYLNKARSFIRNGRLAPPPPETANEPSEQMPLQISSSTTSAAGTSRAAQRTGRTGPAALLVEEETPWQPGTAQRIGTGPVIIKTPEPTRRVMMPMTTTARAYTQQKSVPSTHSEPRLAPPPLQQGRTSSSTVGSTAISGGDVHRRSGGISRRRIFNIAGGSSSQQDAENEDNLREDEDEVGDDGGRKDLLRHNR